MPQVEGSTVRFKDASTTLSTPITSWNWDFGDGETSTEQNPRHVYSDDGNYEVTLTVTNKEKSTHSVTNIATILDMSPAAGFTYEPKPATVGEPVTFTDLSKTLQDDLVSWHWDLGDGTTSSEQNPVHTYAEEGSITVKLVVTDEDGSIDSITYPIKVNKPSLCDKPSTIYHHGDPTPIEQYLLELINRARADPFAEGKRLGIDIEAGIQSPVTPQPPLAMNAILHGVAQAHCEDMRDHEFSQTDSEGYSYKERISNAGYPGRPVGENIATGDTAVNLYKMLVREVDPKSELNHREIILGLKYAQNEIGIGFIEASGKHDSYLTLDYGYQSEEAFLLGVVYLDKDEDGFYDVGEGLSGVTVMPSEGDYYAVTSSSGGYAIPLTESGLLMVTASGGGLDEPVSRVVVVNVPGDNVKLDFIISPDPVESHELKITVEGMGVTCPDSGIVHRFGSGSQLLLSAKPVLGWEFSHWEIGEQTFTVNPSELALEEDQMVTAVFTETMITVHRLVIAVEGSGTTDPPPGSMEVEEGIVSVEALPDEGWMFVEWMLNGETVGDENPLELTVEDDVKLVALFTEKIKTEPEKVSTGNPISDLIKAITDLINQLLKLFGGG
jgi:PKD repeat protein